MKRLTDYEKIKYMADRISAEKVYSLSIMEGVQEGEIFVDDDNAPCDVSFKWVSLVWQILGIDPDNIEHIVYDKTREIAEKEDADRKRSEEHFKKVLLKPDSFEWRKLYYDNYIPKDDNLDGCWLLQGYYLLLFKKVDTCRVDGHMMKTRPFCGDMSITVLT